MTTVSVDVPDNDELPHGHGRSYKKGLVVGLVRKQEDADEFIAALEAWDQEVRLPEGHDRTFRRGKAAGEQLREAVKQRLKD